MRRAWFGVAVAGLALLLALSPWRAPAQGGSGGYQVTINEVVVESSSDFFAAGSDGDIVDFTAHVSYTVTLPDGTEVENPTGENLGYVVNLDYTWTWVTNADDFGVPSEDLVDAEWVSDNHYRVRFLQPGDYRTNVHVTAWVTPVN